MKILIYSDLHLSATTPVKRIDNYALSMMKKLKQIYQKATEADVVLFLGDFFNTHRSYSYEMINEAIEAVTVPTHAILGQHDLVGYNPDSYASSALCFVEKHCEKWSTMKSPLEIGGVTFHPCHTYEDFDIKARQNLPDGKHILLSHHLITKNSCPYDTYLLSDYADIAYDGVFFGDYHPGMKPIKQGKTLWWGAGSIARQAISDRERKPKIGWFDTDTMELVEEQIEVVSFEEVFNMATLDEVDVQGDYADDFVDSVMRFHNESVDIYDLLQKVASKESVRAEVLDYILEKKKQLVIEE